LLGITTIPQDFVGHVVSAVRAHNAGIVLMHEIIRIHSRSYVKLLLLYLLMVLSLQKLMILIFNHL